MIPAQIRRFRERVLVLLVGLIGLLPAYGSAESFPLEQVRGLLPKDGDLVDVMAMAAPERCQELSAKFKAGVSLHPEWWLDYVKKGEPGQPLAYHPNFGMTEAEYEEMSQCITEMRLEKIAEAKLGVKSDGPDRYILDGGEKLPSLSGIVIDLQTQVVETPFGLCRTWSRIEASSSQRVTGPWEGYQWTAEEGVSDLQQAKGVDDVMSADAFFAKFSLGRFQSEPARGLLRYKVTRLHSGEKEDKEFILRYTIPFH